MKELGIYIHIPFCKRKCIYCDFISFQGKEEKITKYIDTLLEEINRCDLNKEEYLVKTIYIGGGTPSYIDSKNIKEILNVLRKKFNVFSNAEITIEVNPGTVTKDKLSEYISCGINRLSIGLQSTNDNLLKLIGRIHTYQEFLDTYNLAREVGFKNINVDLIMGLPTQNMQDVEEDLKNVISLNPEHISCYSLIVEEGTKLEEKIKNNELLLPPEELERKMYWKIKNTLEENGYIHYEISNFAKEGYESKHNLACWNQEEYIGFGLAAHSYLNNKRYSNTEDLEEYINKNGLVKNTNEIQDKEAKMKEFMLLGLRKISGVKISEFKNRFVENPIYKYRDILSKLVEEELIEIGLDDIKLTNKGIDFANIVWEEFV